MTARVNARKWLEKIAIIVKILKFNLPQLRMYNRRCYKKNCYKQEADQKSNALEMFPAPNWHLQFNKKQSKLLSKMKQNINKSVSEIV